MPPLISNVRQSRDAIDAALDELVEFMATQDTDMGVKLWNILNDGVDVERIRLMSDAELEILGELAMQGLCKAIERGAANVGI